MGKFRDSARFSIGFGTGVAVWGVTVSLLNFGLRAAWPHYAEVERAMAFTLPMLLARLAESAIASVAGGAAAAVIGRRDTAGLASGLALLLLFLPVHYRLWPVFPIWYHLVFLASLPLLGWAGGCVSAGRRPARLA